MKSPMLRFMNAAEIIEEIVRLPENENEKGKVVEFVRHLPNVEPLDEKFRDHYLIGNSAGCRECHIRPDWLLIYQATDTDFLLVRTGPHSELLIRLHTFCH